jgi:hypothetical protein
MIAAAFSFSLYIGMMTTESLFVTIGYVIIRVVPTAKLHILNQNCQFFALKISANGQFFVEIRRLVVGGEVYPPPRHALLAAPSGLAITLTRAMRC